MKKKLLMFATSALMLTACSNDSDVVPNDIPQLQAQSGAVMFDTYTSSATKVGAAGIQTTDKLKETNKGFGVFAQYSNDGNYDNSVNPTNFMWNQQVKFKEGAWTYSPLKYWPNETDNDSQSPAAEAEGDHIDRLSFFAYAPYVEEQASTYGGVLNGIDYAAGPEISDSHVGYPAMDKGITSIIGNNTTGNDPWVRYTVASNPEESVDLLWGVAPSGGLHYTAVNGVDIDVDEGMPLVNLVKPNKDQKIKFLFKHALARIGMTIVAAVDQIAPGGTLDANTKIVVESVRLDEVTAEKKLKMKGALNLNNSAGTDANWVSTSDDVTGLTVTNADLLNPDIEWDTDAATSFAKAGVTTTEKPVIKDGSGNLHYFMVIPGHANTDLKVTIAYYVITEDAKVAGGYSVVKNVINKTVTVNGLTNNKAYNLKLVLGLTSVKMEAEVADWQVDGSTEVYLPQNVAE